jgi:hypothetical protein
VDSLTKNWNQFLDTILDWAPQLEYRASDSQKEPEQAWEGPNKGQLWVGEKADTVSQ